MTQHLVIACVFSTGVEVILRLVVPGLSMLSILHRCGGDPGGWIVIGMKDVYSPQVWR